MKEQGQNFGICVGPIPPQKPDGVLFSSAAREQASMDIDFIALGCMILYVVDVMVKAPAGEPEVQVSRCV
ncbi:MAG: hypothetical protein ACE5DQ_01660 [Candidatus Paceibacterota bacterium]